MDWLVLASVVIVHPHWRARNVGGSVIRSLIQSGLYLNYFGLQFKFTHQAVLVIASCSVATCNDASCIMRGIRGYFCPARLV